MKIDRRLIPVKIIYFCSLAGLATLVVYIAPFLVQRGMSKSEVAVTGFVASLLGFFSRPLFGAVADKLQRFKEVMIFITITSAVVFNLMLLIPSHDPRIEYYKGELKLSRNLEDPKSLTLCMSNTDANDSAPCWPLHLGGCWSMALARKNISVIDMLLQDPSVSAHCAVYNFSETRQLVKTSAVDSNELRCSMIVKNRSSVCNLNGTEKERTFSPVHTNKMSWSLTFFLAVLLRGLSNFLFSPWVSLTDAVTFAIIADKPHKYGYTRLFGSLGFLVFALVTAFAIFGASKSTEPNYLPCFMLYIGLAVVGCFASAMVKIGREIHTKSPLRALGLMCMSPQVGVFFVMVLAHGACMGVLENFVFVAIGQLLSPPHYFFGLMNVMSMACETPVMAISGRIIEKFGEAFCICIAFLAWALRFLSYSLVQNPWPVLVIELLHGVGFGLSIPAFMTYANKIAPPGAQGTMQGLVSGVYFGFGSAGGCLLGGFLYDVLGARTMFRLFALFALICAVFYGVAAWLFHRFSPKSSEIPVDGTAGQKDEKMTEMNGESAHQDVANGSPVKREPLSPGELTEDEEDENQVGHKLLSATNG